MVHPNKVFVLNTSCNSRSRFSFEYTQLLFKLYNYYKKGDAKAEKIFITKDLTIEPQFSDY